MVVSERKEAYFQRVWDLVDEYSLIFIVHADNVGSFQMQKIRIALRGKAEILMGKNTMIRRALRSKIAANPALEKLMALLRGNVGLVFVNADLAEVRSIINENNVAAPARAGSIAPVDVIVPAGQTSLEPTMTSFFQALDIQTKINKGAIEILKNVPLLSIGDKVGQSEATLLAKLNIMPFSYGLIIQHVYDNGSVYSPAILDITNEDMENTFRIALQNVCEVSLAVGIPTIVSLPHLFRNAFKNVMAVSIETDYDIPQTEQAKAYLADPEAFSAAAAAAAPAAAAGGDAAPAAAAEQEEEEEGDDDMGFGLFD